MTKRGGRLLASAALMVGLTAGSARAQTPAQLNYAGRGTELGGAVGAARSSSDTGLTVIGTADWDITRWMTIEAAGGWFARGAGVNGVSADIGALVNLVPKRRATPYIGLAFGLYRATIDAGNADVPAFYAGRMQNQAAGAASLRTFTDPAWRFSAGVDVIRRRDISVRPEAAVVVVHRRGATDTITTFGVRLGFVFEDHPVTPSTR
jgi:hypothetical protein